MAKGVKTGGRKKGATNIRTREIAEKAIASGLSPLEIMLENMHFAHSGAEALLSRMLDSPDKPSIDELKSLVGFRQQSQECAKDAAPYIHPRLAAVENKITPGAGLKKFTLSIETTDDGAA